MKSTANIADSLHQYIIMAIVDIICTIYSSSLIGLRYQL